MYWILKENGGMVRKGVEVEVCLMRMHWGHLRGETQAVSQIRGCILHDAAPDLCRMHDDLTTKGCG